VRRQAINYYPTHYKLQNRNGPPGDHFKSTSYGQTTTEAAKEVFDSSNFSATNVAGGNRNRKIKSL